MYRDGPRFRGWPRRTRLGLLAAVSLVALASLWFVPRIALGPMYHRFADTRTMWGIPNCVDTLSNIPFALVGIWGVLWLLLGSSKSSFAVPRERIPYLVFFSGVALTGVGSFWYHLAPSDSRLPWDLLPLTCCFMSMVVIVINERISVSVGLWAFLPLLALGIASVVYWYLTEMQGRGDYRFYLFVQFFSPLLIALTIALFRPRYTGTDYLLIAFGLYVLAKLFEWFDGQIYSLTGVVSGHSLKHVTAALSCYWILRMLQRRHALKSAADDACTLSFVSPEC
jgi:hypothetical protein